VEENRVLREQRVATIVTPDTILHWYRRLIAEKWTVARTRPGRPAIMKEVSSLILRMAMENPARGYRRIQGALKNLDHCASRSTVAKELKDNGLPPAPERPSSRRTFLRAHWDASAGADSFTTEVWTPRGLVTYDPLFVIDLRSRQVHVVLMFAQAPNANAYAERFVRSIRKECLGRLVLFGEAVPHVRCRQRLGELLRDYHRAA